MIKKSIKTKIKQYFFRNPTQKLRVRQIERKVKVSLPSAISQTQELVKQRILKKINISNIVLFSADRTSEKYLLEKKLFNIKELYDSGLVERLKELYGQNSVFIIFGSYSRGEDIEDSDIDIYIQSKKNKDNLSEFEDKLNRKIQLFIHENLKKIKNKELINNILNGIIINGYLEVY